MECMYVISTILNPIHTTVTDIETSYNSKAKPTCLLADILAVAGGHLFLHQLVGVYCPPSFHTGDLSLQVVFEVLVFLLFRGRGTLRAGAAVVVVALGLQVGHVLLLHHLHNAIHRHHLRLQLTYRDTNLFICTVCMYT